MTDKELEILWDELEDVTCIEAKDFYSNDEDYKDDISLVIASDWQEFYAGTSVTTIWEWFDKYHSKGLDWLLNGRSSESTLFKVGDIVFVSNPDTEYEDQMGVRVHSSFFGKVIDVQTYGEETCVEVEFPTTPNGPSMEWSYHPEELSLASELKDMTLEEFSNKYSVAVMAEYI